MSVNLSAHYYFCIKLQTYEIQFVPLDNKRITLRVSETIEFEIDIEVRPLNGVRARHLHVQHAADGSILHPRDAVVRQEIVVAHDGEHDALGVNHQYACRCAGGTAA